MELDSKEGKRVVGRGKALVRDGGWAGGWVRQVDEVFVAALLMVLDLRFERALKVGYTSNGRKCAILGAERPSHVK